MNHMERISRLRTMLQQVSPDDDLDALPIPPREQVEGEEALELPGNGRPGTVPMFGYDDALSGIRKLKEKRDDQVSPAEMFGVEAIVLARDRPAVFVRAGTYDHLGGVWAELDTSAVRARINPLLGSVGRIELPNMFTVPYGGTGFLVGPSLLMTNRHVARLFAEGLGRTRLVYRPGDAMVDFKCEVDSNPEQATPFSIERVLMIHPYWDMALLQVSGLSPAYTPLTLSIRAPEDMVGREMVAVGYPARDDRNDLALQDRIFGRVYNVKRLQPGKLRRRMRVRSFENDVDAMVHDSTTLGGSSGSAVIDVATGHIVGLHFAGEYLKANYAVPSYELARDQRVLDAGLQFEGKIGVTDLWEPAWIAAEGGEAARAPRQDAQMRQGMLQSPQPSPQPSPQTGMTVTPPLAADAGVIDIPISLRIMVDVGGAPSMAGVTARQPGRSERTATPAAQPGKRIGMRELQEMMRDPSIDDHQLRQYFIGAPSVAKPFAPGIIPNPALVDVAEPRDMVEGAMMMDWANGLSRLRRQEKFRLRLATGDRRPVLVSEGDSWFQFPVLLSDVIDNLQGDYNIWSVDAAGDTLQNMVFDNAEYMKALRNHAGSVRAFLFSGGGNDIVGEDARGQSVLAQIVRRFEAGRPAHWYVDTPAVAQKMRFVEECYRRVLDNVTREFPDLPIVCHGYDHAVPGGAPDDPRRPGWAAADKWLGKPMREQLGIADPELQRAIVRELIDRLNLMLARLCGASNPDGVFRNAWHVDVRGTVAGRWADELHPNDEGFAAAAGLFGRALRGALRLPQEGVAAAGPGEERTPNLGDDEEAVALLRDAGGATESLEAARGWRVAECLLALREQINRLAPRRSKLSDGTIGDDRHRTRESDHNAWVEDGRVGVVTALDVTHDPSGGCDCENLARSLRESRDPRIKYVIWNRQIMSSSAIGGAAPWEWRNYGGRNPHTKHLHVSVKPDKASYDSAAPWRIAL